MCPAWGVTSLSLPFSLPSAWAYSAGVFCLLTGQSTSQGPMQRVRAMDRTLSLWVLPAVLRGGNALQTISEWN